ncbi:MAG: UDP-N-acetylmuramoyl-L-alanine--D-glutamate ligase, partial [Proteobacteria bacterium]|nr:UDP-N-acetylmuramoyl-L-alanine--D-glutamate ligase [Pseudomonadota bacterium]
MNAVKKMALADRNLVLGLGVTGLSIARYLRRNGLDATFYDSRENPPGADDLADVWPDADVITGDAKFPKKIGRIVVSPGIADSHPMLVAARKAKREIVSDIELFARDAQAPFVAVTGSNGKSTVTT